MCGGGRAGGRVSYECFQVFIRTGRACKLDVVLIVLSPGEGVGKACVREGGRVNYEWFEGY